MLLNSLGQIVFSENEIANTNYFKKTIDTTSLPQGIYLLQIFIDGKLISHKIIKQ